MTAKSYQIADFHRAIEFYYERGWTDGLPIIPPTEDKVMATLEKGGLLPSDVLGVVSDRGRVATAEKVAINSVMAGCLPEYMPVVAAAVRAICDDAYNLHGSTLSTGGASVLLVVNGPVRLKLGFNSGINVLGPGCRANATIGRAIRLILMNVFGSSPGALDRSTLGHPGKYSFCFAENEEENPWEPLHVERGFAADRSTVTAFASFSPWQIGNAIGETPESALDSTACIMSVAGVNQNEIIAVLSPEMLLPIKRAGWTKRDVREYLFQQILEHSKNLARIKRSSSRSYNKVLQQTMSVCHSYESISLIIAGGQAGAFSAVIPLWGSRILDSENLNDSMLTETSSCSVIKEIDTSHI